LRDRIGVDPHPIEIEDNARPQDGPWRVNPFVGFEDAETAEPSDALRSSPDARSNLFLGKPFTAH
jgi:hypothetical protein